jgi:hypothetical protein
MNRSLILRCLALWLLTWAGLALAAEPSAAPAVAGHVAFINGQVSLTNGNQAARTVQTGDPVYVGDRIQTQADSHLHLRMIDNAFVALRPLSQLVISTYEYDKDQPQASRIRIDLQQGTSRAVSGKGGQAAKHQYRFNTPLAAIGLRGTDYTVVADSDKTRVSVTQGGVIVSPLGAGCLSSQLGPCMTPLSRELTANMPNAFIEVTPNQPPRLLTGSVAQAPTAPAKTETAATDDPAKRAALQQSIDRAEMAAKATATAVAATAAAAAETAKIAALPDVNATPAHYTPVAQWGRWSTLVQQLPAGSGSINSVFSQMADFQIVGSNDAVALAYPGKTPVSLPDQGRVQFSLVAAEAYVKDGAQFSRAGVKSGQLEMDFALNTFNTLLNVATSPSRVETVQAQGTVDAYGRMQSTTALSNANIKGIVLNKGFEATYLFDKTLATGSTLSGAAQWTR